jgi:hypothetical protein
MGKGMRRSRLAVAVVCVVLGLCLIGAQVAIHRVTASGRPRALWRASLPGLDSGLDTSPAAPGLGGYIELWYEGHDADDYQLVPTAPRRAASASATNAKAGRGVGIGHQQGNGACVPPCRRRQSHRRLLAANQESSASSVGWWSGTSVWRPALRWRRSERMKPLRIRAAQEIGRRRGRREVTAKVRGVAQLLRLGKEEPPSAT